MSKIQIVQVDTVRKRHAAGYLAVIGTHALEGMSLVIGSMLDKSSPLPGIKYIQLAFNHDYEPNFLCTIDGGDPTPFLTTLKTPGNLCLQETSVETLNTVGVSGMGAPVNIMDPRLHICYLYDEAMRDLREEALGQHELWAEHHGLCEQCQEPWNDGLCDCSSNVDCIASVDLKSAWIDLMVALWDMNQKEDTLLT